MATIWISDPSSHLDDEEMATLRRLLREYDAPPLSEAEDGDVVAGDAEPLDRSVDDDTLADFMDQLDALDAACEIYLPIEFEDVFEVGRYRVGSAHALAIALESLKEDLEIDEHEEADELEEEDEDEDEDVDDEPRLVDDETDQLGLKEQQIRHLWRLFKSGAAAAVDRGLSLVVLPG